MDTWGGETVGRQTSAPRAALASHARRGARAGRQLMTAPLAALVVAIDMLVAMVKVTGNYGPVVDSVFSSGRAGAPDR